MIDAMGMVKVNASVLFPAAPKHITLSLRGDLSIFEWPMNGSNMSSYLGVPRDWPVTVYRVLEAGQEVPISWAEAEAEGLGVFSVRAIVTPCSTKEVFLQLGAVPFSIDHLLSNYTAVYDECFFPNTMIQVSRVATKLLPEAKKATSKLVKRVQLVAQDRAGFGLGVLPFFFAARFNPRKDLIQVPKLEVIRKALVDFMGMTRMAVSKNAGNLPAALAVALEGDQNPANVLPPMRTPWSGVLVSAVTAPPPPPPEQGM